MFQNYVLGGILQTAFYVDRLSLEAPDWIFDERFDITDRVPDEEASLDERRQMLQALLIDRFGMAFHRETKLRAGFGLVIAKSGPKIQPVPDVGSHDNDNRKDAETAHGNRRSCLGPLVHPPAVEPRKLPVDTFVVDRLQKMPTEN